MNRSRMVFLSILILVGLYISSLYSYILFHSMAEIFSIVIACGIFMIAWNARQFFANNYLLFIGIAYLFVGLVMDPFQGGMGLSSMRERAELSGGLFEIESAAGKGTLLRASWSLEPLPGG